MSNHLENNANMEDMETVPHLTVKIVFEFRMFCCPVSTGQRYSAVVLLLCSLYMSHVEVYLINPIFEYSLQLLYRFPNFRPQSDLQ